MTRTSAGPGDAGIDQMAIALSERRPSVDHDGIATFDFGPKMDMSISREPISGMVRYAQGTSHGLWMGYVFMLNTKGVLANTFCVKWEDGRRQNG
jgi:hypothetical protein